MTPLEARIQEIEAREKAATPGPWRWTVYHPEISLLSMEPGHPVVLTSIENDLATSINGVLEPLSPMDSRAQFIAHSRSDIPFLLQALKVYRDALILIESNPREYAVSAMTRIFCKAALAETEKLAEEMK